MNARLICIAGLLAAACHFGARTRNFPPATTANGITVVLRTRGPDVDRSGTAVRSLRGQLLAITDTSLLLVVAPNVPMVNGRVLLISSPLLSVDFRQLGEYRRLSSIPPRERERIRLASQFPQGITADLANRILEAYGQAELVVWTGTTDRRIPRSGLAEIFPTNPRDDAAAADAFIASARAGTQRFTDRAQAIREGYRRVGVEFPFMGEHWVHPSVVVDGKLSAEKPAVLTYAMRGNTPVLVGVGYAAIGQTPQDFPPGGAVWHDHNGTVADALLTVHTGAHTSAARDPRFFVLHAWVWTPNPDGPFTTDNLALPFVRAGLEPPAHIERSAASALSLAYGGDTFFVRVLTHAAGASSSETPSIETAIARATRQVEEWRRQVDGGASLSHEQLLQLASIWQSLSNFLLTTLEPAHAERLKPYLLTIHH